MSYKTQSAQNPALSRVSAWIRAPPLLSQMLSFLHGFLTNAGRNSIPTLSAARDDGISRRPRPGDAPTSTLIWGPISYTDAQAAGAHAPTSSVLLRPVVDPDVRSAALMEVPYHAWQRVHDTAGTLRDRLGASTFFEDSHVFKGGRLGKKRVRLNETEYPQPRRRSWSVQVAAAQLPFTRGEVITG